MADNFLCIIPARGGSKRIPRKNIKNFKGRPIISYSIKAALDSGIFEEVMVSTEDIEIAEIGKKFGASVPFFRSSETADDHASTVDVLLEVLDSYEKLGKTFSHVCCLYPTAPFVTSKKLIEARTKLVNANMEVVFPVIPYSFPVQRSVKIKDGNLEFLFPENENSRSQDLEKIYHDAGQFYFIDTNFLRKNKSIMGERTGSIIVDELEAQDIDNQTDWKLAELKYDLLQDTE
jgi:pseudaminic acid cytidylyltransferase